MQTGAAGSEFARGFLANSCHPSAQININLQRRLWELAGVGWQFGPYCHLWSRVITLSACSGYLGKGQYPCSYPEGPHTGQLSWEKVEGGVLLDIRLQVLAR